MSTYLTAQSLTLAHATSPLFEQLSFTIRNKDRIGLIGHNGCGKSTLLKLLSGRLEASSGHIATSQQCLVSYVEQHIPPHLATASLYDAVAESLVEEEGWRAEVLLSELGFAQQEWQLAVEQCSGGQQMRILLARAIINQPDLLLLDEPSNHLDLPSLLWLEKFLNQWKGAFVLVSHDQMLLDRVTNSTWIMRDKTIHHFNLSCSCARKALTEQDEADKLRHNAEQKEIDRIEKSAKRLALWGKIYDNEDLARKAKTMTARKERLEAEQTELTQLAPWRLTLDGKPLAANRLLDIGDVRVSTPDQHQLLFAMQSKQVKSGDRIAVLGANGCGKSTLLNMLHNHYLHAQLDEVTFHQRCLLGYYDQSLSQLNNFDSPADAVRELSSCTNEQGKRALISAGFGYQRHQQPIANLSGGEKSRLLFVALSLASYHLIFLDEPTNHLDLEGKEELIETLNQFKGATLIVSHDRNLIEQSCNRFWLVQNQQLVEFLRAEEAYAQIENQTELSNANQSASEQAPVATTCEQPSPVAEDEEKLLERLIELESLLEADLNRRTKHQKPDLQRQWRSEIAQIAQQL